MMYRRPERAARGRLFRFPRCSIPFCSYTAFFFGFIQMEYIYDERRDEGVQLIPFRASPGNETEKMFDFHLILSSITSTFTFGGIFLQSAQK